MSKDMNGKECRDEEAPYCPYAPGLDPKIGYKQKIKYAPDSLYPKHYNTKNK